MKRKTRVQIAILRNEQVLLLQHVMPKQNKTFWGFPGGGVEGNETPEEAAIREAREETGLDIELDDFKHEYFPENNLFYDRVVTFIGYPVSGEARLGHDPEEGMSEIVRLTGIKWHPLDDDEGMDGVRKDDLKEIRKFLKDFSKEN